MNELNNKQIGLFDLISLIINKKIFIILYVIFFTLIGFYMNYLNNFKSTHIHQRTIQENKLINNDPIFFYSLLKKLIYSEQAQSVMMARGSFFDKDWNSIFKEEFINFDNQVFNSSASGNSNSASFFTNNSLLEYYFNMINTDSFKKDYFSKLRERQLNLGDIIIKTQFINETLRSIKIKLQSNQKRDFETLIDIYYKLSVANFKNDIGKILKLANKMNDSNKKIIVRTLRERNGLLVRQFFLEKEKNIASLEEQAAIAKKLNIKFGVNETRSIYFDEFFKNAKTTSISRNNVFWDVSNMAYLRGYETLNKEIEVTKSRIDASKYIPEISVNQKSMEILSDKNFDKELINEIKNYNLENLMPLDIVADQYYIVRNYYINVYSYIIIFLFFIFGLLSSVLLIVIQDQYKKYIKKQKINQVG